MLVSRFRQRTRLQGNITLLMRGREGSEEVQADDLNRERREREISVPVGDVLRMFPSFKKCIYTFISLSPGSAIGQGGYLCPGDSPIGCV